MNNEELIFTTIKTERIRQNAKWGEQNHEPLYWLGILMEEVGETAKALIEIKTPIELYYVRKELVEVAAVAVAFIDSLDRNEIGQLEGRNK